MRVRVAVMGVTLLLASCQKQESKPDPAAQKAEAAPVRVETAPIAARPVPDYLVLTGTLKSSQESEVAADANGKVISTLVERGQEVKQGDVLATLDTRGASLTASAAQAQANLTRSQLEQAQRECDRVKALLDTGAISRAEYDRTTSQCQSTQYALAAAEANQRQAVKILGDATIRAPFAGVVGERLVNVGQYVQPQTRVATLYALDPLRLELTVPESSVGAVKQGATVTFKVASFDKDTFTGTVKFISPNLRQSTRDLVVEAQVPNADRRLRPGMFATARLHAGERTLAVVPASSVKSDGVTSRVFVVVQGLVQERIVQTTEPFEGSIPILVGVKAGESVVVNPGADVKDGARAL